MMDRDPWAPDAPDAPAAACDRCGCQRPPADLTTRGGPLVICHSCFYELEIEDLLLRLPAADAAAERVRATDSGEDLRTTWRHLQERVWEVERVHWTDQRGPLQQ